MLGAALAAVAVLVLRGRHRGGTRPLRDLEGLLHEGAVDGLRAETGGGIANAIVGTIVIVGIATLIALPVGILVAVYASEFAPAAVRRVVSFVLDILNGLPSIVIGIFIFGLIVVGRTSRARSQAVSRSRSSCCRSSRAPRRRCSRSCRRPCARRASRSASAAGGRRLGVTIPASFGGILTGGTLAIARAAGETAPLLFTCALTTTQVSWDPQPAAAVHSSDDLRGPREPRSGAPRSGVGGGARAVDLRARDQRRSRRPRLARSRRKLDEMKRGYDRHGGSDRGRPARKHADDSSRDGLRHPRPVGVLRRHARGRATSTSRSTATWSPP